jgi:hypothetical protein
VIFAHTPDGVRFATLPDTLRLRVSLRSDPGLPSPSALAGWFANGTIPPFPNPLSLDPIPFSLLPIAFFLQQPSFFPFFAKINTLTLKHH